jgi:hypothetical protein
MNRTFQPLRAAAHVLLWMGGLLGGIATVQGAALPLLVAFLASMAALYVLRECDATC